MNHANSYNTLDLLHTDCDAVHIIFHNVFRLLKPIRRKYRLSVNECIVLNGFYLLHKYKGSVITINMLYNWIGYYNRNKIKYYIGVLIDKGLIEHTDKIKDIEYYKITLAGVNIMTVFNDSYQEILYKWYSDKNISV